MATAARASPTRTAADPWRASEMEAARGEQRRTVTQARENEQDRQRKRGRGGPTHFSHAPPSRRTTAKARPTAAPIQAPRE